MSIVSTPNSLLGIRGQEMSLGKIHQITISNQKVTELFLNSLLGIRGKETLCTPSEVVITYKHCLFG